MALVEAYAHESVRDSLTRYKHGRESMEVTKARARVRAALFAGLRKTPPALVGPV